MFTTITKCRVCASHDLRTVVDLLPQALGGRFESPERVNDIPIAPLHLVQCAPQTGCGLVQLKDSCSPSELYGSSYGYRSGLNASMVSHLREKVARLLALNVLEPGDVVIDIGANDGTTLACYPPGAYTLVAVDPACDKFAHLYRPDIVRLNAFFGKATLSTVLGGRRAKIITSFSMFYDLESPVEFAREVAGLLDEGGVWVTEQSYLPAMLDAGSFDTICHEHLEYYSLTQMNYIAEQAGLALCDVEFNDVNGGSFSVVLGHRSAFGLQNRARIEQVLDRESRLGLDDGSAFAQFRERIERAREGTRRFIADCRDAGQRVAGLGASTKGNVLLQYYGLDSSLIDVIGEVNPDKFGRVTPGTRIPIAAEDDVLASNPDHLLVLPWHFRPFFESEPKFKGRSLIFPLPSLSVVSAAK